MLDILEEGWDIIVESLEYVFTFEWFGDFWESLTGIFDNIGELSILGIAFGLLSAGIVYGLKDFMLMPFLKYYDPIGQIVWGGITYVGCFVAGYLLGKHFENSN